MNFLSGLGPIWVWNEGIRVFGFTTRCVRMVHKPKMSCVLSRSSESRRSLINRERKKNNSFFLGYFSSCPSGSAILFWFEPKTTSKNGEIPVSIQNNNRRHRDTRLRLDPAVKKIYLNEPF